MSITYEPAAPGGTTVELQDEAGDTPGERRAVHGLPAATTAFLATLPDIEDKIEDVNTNLGDIHQAVDAVETKLDTVHSDLNPASCVTGQNTDIDTASEDLGSQACTIGAMVKNISTGSQKIYVSPNNVTATTTNGWELAVGEQEFFPCRDISELKVIASAVNAVACWKAV